MKPKGKPEQTDPVEQTMRKVVIGFIAISVMTSLIYLWFDVRQMKEEQVINSKSVPVETSTDE